MKTSVFGFGTSGMNWTQAIDYVAALGAAGIEPYPMAELQTPSLPAARRIGDYAREKGLELPCFSTAAQLTGEKAPAEIGCVRGDGDIVSSSYADSGAGAGGRAARYGRGDRRGRRKRARRV